MEKFKINKQLTFDQFISEGYSSRLASNFGMEHIQKQQEERWSKYNPQVFICDAEDKETFGLGFIVLLRYKADGLTFLKRITSYGSSSLTSMGLRYATSLAFFNNNSELNFKTIIRDSNLSQEEKDKILLSFTTITIGNEYFDKGEENRKIWRSQTAPPTLY